MRAAVVCGLAGIALASGAAAATDTNLLPNGTFDSGIAGWTVQAGAGMGTLAPSDDDADGSASSGSIEFDTDAQGSQTLAISPCFAIPAGGAYSVGAQGRIVTVGGISLASFVYNFSCSTSSTTDCSGPSAGSQSLDLPNSTAWSAVVSASGTLADNTKSARCAIFAQNVFNSAAASVRLDNLFFTADHIFRNGFE